MSDPEGKLWCSTKVDELGNHVKSGGFWGRCNEDCNKNVEEVQQPERSFTTVLEGKRLSKFSDSQHLEVGDPPFKAKQIWRPI